MPFDPETATFLVAGPVRIHPRVLRAMGMPSLNHRGDYFHGIVSDIRELLPVMFGTKGTQLVLTGSGTAGLEATYSSLLRPNERTVVVSNGNFGERTDKIAHRYSGAVTTIASPWGQHFNVEAVRAELEKGDVRALCIVYNETSVGLRNDLAQIVPAVRKSGALLLVDGISAVAGIPCPIAEWGVDAMVAGAERASRPPRGSPWCTSPSAPSPSSRAAPSTSTSPSTSRTSPRTTPPGPPPCRSSWRCARRSSSSRRRGWRRGWPIPMRWRKRAGRRWTPSASSCSPDRRYASDTVTAIRNPAPRGRPGPQGAAEHLQCPPPGRPGRARGQDLQGRSHGHRELRRHLLVCFAGPGAYPGQGSAGCRAPGRRSRRSSHRVPAP